MSDTPPTRLDATEGRAYALEALAIAFIKTHPDPAALRAMLDKWSENVRSVILPHAGTPDATLRVFESTLDQWAKLIPTAGSR